MKRPDDLAPAPTAPTDGVADASPTEGWWEAALTRREAAQRAGLGGMAVLLGAAGLGGGLVGCGGNDERVESRDALEVQQQTGWAVGAEEDRLDFSGWSPHEDSKKGADWKAYKDPARLLAATQPKQEAWRGFAAPTLFQALAQQTLAEQMRPIWMREMDEAHARGPALASLMTHAEEPGKTLLILDLPGPQSVALAAGMATQIEPVFHFDNWPHPHGVVPSHDTLGAVLYYAVELEEKKAKRPDTAPVALVLDSNRLTDPGANPDAFDNRYVATLPSAKALVERGITRVLYVTERALQTELDDLNDDFVSYGELGLNVAMVPLIAFQRDLTDTEDSITNGYYYGGSRQTHGGFYSFYPMFLYLPGPSPRWGTSEPFNVKRPQYKPAPRPTRFSSRRTGGTAGVGRTKPTGFGRVSARVNAAGHVVGTGYRATSRGTSGSYGRSRSSFGGG